MQNRILIFLIYLLCLSIIYPQKGQLITGTNLAGDFNFSYRDTINTNQNINNPPAIDTAETISRIHFQMTIGLSEFLSLGIGYNFDKNNAIIIKNTGVVLGHGYLGGGYGLKYTYSLKSSYIIKNISLTATALDRITVDENQYNRNKLFKGWALEISTERGKNFYSWFILQYEFGIMLTKYLDNRINVLPNFKIGFNINF
ncbi:MAG: hypothetical protein V1773_13415 [bacterium]